MILTEKETAGDTYVLLFLAGEIGNSRKSRTSHKAEIVKPYCLYIADTVKKLLGR